MASHGEVVEVIQAVEMPVLARRHPNLFHRLQRSMWHTHIKKPDVCATPGTPPGNCPPSQKGADELERLFNYADTKGQFAMFLVSGEQSIFERLGRQKHGGGH